MDQLAKFGTVYIHCKLGYSRSATVAVAWLVHHGDATNIEEAIALVEQARSTSYFECGNERTTKLLVYTISFK